VRALWPAAALTGVLGLLHGIGARELFTPATHLENAAYDVHYRWRASLSPAPPPDERLLLLGYDDATRELESGRATGYHVVAEALEKLAAAKPRMVLLDFRLDTSHFAALGARLERLRLELPPGTPLEQTEELRQLASELSIDERMAAAMRLVPTVLVSSCPPGVLETAPMDPVLLLKSRPLEGVPPPRVRRAGRVQGPSSPLAAAAFAIGHSCEFQDGDGVLRTDAAALGVPNGAEWVYLPSVAMLLAMETSGAPAEAVRMETGGVRIGNRLLPIGADGEVLLGLSGPSGSFRGKQGKPSRYPVAALIRGEIPASRIEGKVVLIGDTQSGTRDVKLTPFGYGIKGRMPGVEKIAMQVDYLLGERAWLHRPSWAAEWGFLLTIVLGCVAAWAGSKLGFYPALALLALGPVVFLAGTASLTWGGVWIDTGFPALAWTSGILAAAIVRYAQNARERSFLESAFERYLPREMVKAILRDPSALKLMGDEREMTVLFADLRGFTTFSEGNSPATVVAHLNEHLTAMSDVIQKHGGTVDKFIGDAVMAFWGAPIPDADHAQHACAAAQEMLAILDRKNEERIVRGLAQVDMGIGINSGPMIVGNMGSSKRFNYTVIGDAVNLASRLESLTKDFNQRILVGPRTRELAAKAFGFLSLGDVTVKGKQERVPIFSLSEKAAPVSTVKRSPPSRP